MLIQLNKFNATFQMQVLTPRHLHAYTYICIYLSLEMHIGYYNYHYFLSYLLLGLLKCYLNYSITNGEFFFSVDVSIYRLIDLSHNT